MAAKGSLPNSDHGRDSGTERHWWTLVAVCGATFMLLVDITIVQVALPTMQRSLHASFSDLQWVISAYALSLSALILTQGSLADRFGRKRIFIIGLTVFTLASLACGMARSPAELIAARAVQGIGGAAMFATSLALIGQDFQGSARSAAIAVWGATVGGAVAIGPLVGGALTSAFGWQWIFYVNVPIGVLTLLREPAHGERHGSRGQTAGLGRPGHLLGGPVPARPRASPGATTTGGRAPASWRTLAAAGVAARHVRRRRAAPGTAHVRPVAVPQARLHRGVGRHLRHRRRDVRPAALSHPLSPERPRAVPAPGGRAPPSPHDHVVRGPSVVPAPHRAGPRRPVAVHGAGHLGRRASGCSPTSPSARPGRRCSPDSSWVASASASPIPPSPRSPSVSSLPSAPAWRRGSATPSASGASPPAWPRSGPSSSTRSRPRCVPVVGHQAPASGPGHRGGRHPGGRQDVGREPDGGAWLRTAPS